MEPINCRAFLEPISCRERGVERMGTNLRRSFSVVYTFLKLEPITGAIGTIKLAERQLMVQVTGGGGSEGLCDESKWRSRRDSNPRPPT